MIDGAVTGKRKGWFDGCGGVGLSGGVGEVQFNVTNRCVNNDDNGDGDDNVIQFDMTNLTNNFNLNSDNNSLINSINNSNVNSSSNIEPVPSQEPTSSPKPDQDQDQHQNKDQSSEPHQNSNTDPPITDPLDILDPN